MKRRNFIGMTGVGALASVSSYGADEGKEKPDRGIPPVVMAPREDGVEIGWLVSGLRKGYVEYGKTESLGEVARATDWGLRPAGDEVVRVRLDGLETGTEYFYRVVSETFDRKEPNVVRGNLRKFKTLSSKSESTRFSIWNDTHCRKETIEKLNGMTPKSDFLLWNGDISNDWYMEDEVAATILHPGEVDFTERHPLFVLRGNHDLRGTYAYKVEEVAATPSGLPWFAFRSGPVAVLCMDTGEDKDDDNPYLFGRVACEPMRQAQAAWLDEVTKVLEIKNAPYRLVCCHIPLRGLKEGVKRSYDHHSQRSRDLWHTSLVKWGAQLVISGHTHHPYLLDSDESMPYRQLVGGGPKIEEATLITGEADAKSLRVCSTLTTGKVVNEVELKPIV